MGFVPHAFCTDQHNMAMRQTYRRRALADPHDSVRDYHSGAFFFRPSLHRRGCRRTAANSESVWTLKTLKLTMSFRSSCSLITWHRQTCMGRLQRSPERSSCIPGCEKGVSLSSHTINHLRENGRIIMRMMHTSHCARPQRNVFSDRLILLVCAQIWSNNFTFAT